MLSTSGRLGWRAHGLEQDHLCFRFGGFIGRLDCDVKGSGLRCNVFLEERREPDTFLRARHVVEAARGVRSWA